MKFSRRLLDRSTPRSAEQLQNHFEVERELAARLRSSTRQERTALYEHLYSELFNRVPDHPRLHRRESKEQTNRSNQSKFALIKKFLKPEMTVLDFGAGDCHFASFLASKVKQVHALEIADQRPKGFQQPANMHLTLYDGYHLEGIQDCTIDLAFSDQLIEHFHPDDTPLHFQLMYRLLKQGGRYVIRTPSAIIGPHDISKYFSSKPEGFHLKEWTYTELGRLAYETGFTSIECYWNLRKQMIRLPWTYFKFAEWLFSPSASNVMYPFAYLAVPTLCCALKK
jgi:cyclopropane fatty-acyl-phospholipid synthase-like methyltransferase